MNEQDFWIKHRIDPHALACALYAAWAELGDEAEDLCKTIIIYHGGRL